MILLKSLVIYFTLFLNLSFCLLSKEKELDRLPVFKGNTDVEFPKYIFSKLDNKKYKISQTYFFELKANEKGKIVSARLKIGEEDNVTIELIKIILHMPKWKPALKKGKIIEKTFIIPLSLI